MKFKAIFFIFNGIILFSFLFIFLMPLMMLGWEYTRLFWAGNWFIAVFFVLVMAALNLYFLRNWKLFGFLENEEWDGLIAHLEEQIYERRKIRKQYIKLLINASLVRSQPEKIRRLEDFLRAEKPSYLKDFSLPLGVPYLLSNDPVAMESYFKSFLADRKTVKLQWIRFNYAFALVLQHRTAEARTILLDLAQSVKDPVLQLLSAYFLSSFYVADDVAQNTAETVRSFFVKRYTPASWEKQLERMRTNIEVIVLSQLLKEAEEWVFQRTEDAR